MKRRLGIALALVTTLFVGMLAGYSIAYEVTRPSNRVIARWQSPPEIAYDGLKCLVIVEGASRVPHPLFSSSRYHYVYAGRDCDKPGYGHVVDFEPCCYQDIEGDAYWRNADVTWTSEGVTLTLKRSEHRLFIPARAFTGGR